MPLLAGQVERSSEFGVLGAGTGAVFQQQQCQLAVAVQGRHVQRGEAVLVRNVHPEAIGADPGKRLLRKIHDKPIKTIVLCFNQRNSQIPAKFIQNRQMGITRTSATQPNLKPSEKISNAEQLGSIFQQKITFVVLSFLPTR